MTERRTVLIVDDEAQLLRLMSRVVERGGMRALQAATASEARRLFGEHASEIDGVLLDVTMPGGEGAAILLPEFLAEQPGVAVIVTSGDALPADLARELERIGGQFLRKPFVPKALLRMLAAASSESSPSPAPASAPPSPARGPEPGGIS